MSGAQLGYNWSLTPLDYEPRDNPQIAGKHIKMQMFCVFEQPLKTSGRQSGNLSKPHQKKQYVATESSNACCVFPDLITNAIQ